jgi:DNA invertase Pin-like site-specific DNA recombinase
MSRRSTTRPVAAVYARVSTVDQAGPGKISLERQVEECVRLAELQGYAVPEELIFRDTESGARVDRPGFLAMKRAAADGRFSRLFVWAQDRLSRGGMKATLDALDELNGCGVSVYAHQDGDLTDELLAGIRGWMASQERKRIRERTLPPKLRKRDAGHWVTGQPPYGYRLSPEKTLMPCPNESLVVRRIFELATAGYGRIQIARLLNANLVPPPEALVVGPDGRRRRVRIGHHISEFAAFVQEMTGRGLVVERIPEWQSSTVSKILRNKAAFGVAERTAKRPGAGGREILGEYALKIDPCPILDRATFDAAQRALAARRVAPGRGGQQRSAAWLLSGHLVCGACGSRYVHHEARAFHRYCCSARRSGKGCRNPHLPMAKTDRTVLDQVAGHLIARLHGTDDVERYIRGHARSEIASLRRALAAKQTERAAAAAKRDFHLQEWRDARQAGIRESALQAIGDAVNAADEAVVSLDREIADLNGQIVRINADLVARTEDVRRIVARIEHTLALVEPEGDWLTDVRTILDQALERVVVAPSGELTIDLRPQAEAIRGCISAFADHELSIRRDERWMTTASK